MESYDLFDRSIEAKRNLAKRKLAAASIKQAENTEWNRQLDKSEEADRALSVATHAELDEEEAEAIIFEKSLAARRKRLRPADRPPPTVRGRQPDRPFLGGRASRGVVGPGSSVPDLGQVLRPGDQGHAPPLRPPTIRPPLPSSSYSSSYGGSLKIGGMRVSARLDLQTSSSSEAPPPPPLPRYGDEEDGRKQLG